MIYGFIGTGTITEAMVEGLMRSSTRPEARPDKIVLSPRNAEIAGRLASTFDTVFVARSNQDVATQADVVILAVRPQVAQTVLRDISIPKGKKIISVIAATSHAHLAQWTGHAQDDIVRAIPLPFVSTGTGVTAIYPPNPTAEGLFGAIGTAVACATQHEFDLLAIASSMMGPYFGILGGVSDWLVQNGMPAAQAHAYLLPLFKSLADTAAQSPEKTFDDLRHEYSTKGGLNEQVFEVFQKQGGLKALTGGLDRALERAR